MRAPESAPAAFYWLCGFYFFYCARPEDWIHGLGHIPVAKITITMTILGLLVGERNGVRQLRDLPREASYMLALILVLITSAVLSPVWKGGALIAALDFGKVYIAWLVAFLLITNIDRLRRFAFIQASSLPVISFIAIVKGHSTPRLAGVIGGIYSNPNDFAFAIVLSFPLCLAFFITAKDALRKSAWCVAMVVMATALLLTASRAGFIDLAISGAICLWTFGIKGRRYYLVAGAILLGIPLLVIAGHTLEKRFSAMSDESESTSAYESYEQRKALMSKALDAVMDYPILGVGPSNFVVYSNTWKEVHVSYLQITAEAGIPGLILFLLFFHRGFVNLRRLRQMQLHPENELFAGALEGSLIGFIVGACFAPEAYHYFPYFAVCYTSVLVAIGAQTSEAPAQVPVRYTSSGHAVGPVRLAPR